MQSTINNQQPMHTRKYKLKRKTRSRSRSGGDINDWMDWIKAKFNNTGSTNPTGSESFLSRLFGKPPDVPQGQPKPIIPGKPQQPQGVPDATQDSTTQAAATTTPQPQSPQSIPAPVTTAPAGGRRLRVRTKKRRCRCKRK